MGENEKNYLDWEGLLEYHEKLETKLGEKANTEDLADVATSGDYNDLDNTPTNVSLFTNDAGYIASEIDNTNGHDYVEIEGIKWATMNIGAENITDIGLYFQWGDILGYTSEEVGEEKNFTWEDYKFNPSGDGTTFNKYNSTDLKTSLDTEDDAAANAWGSDWRVPTTSELQTLSNAVNVSWTDDYQESGVPGLILTDKEDSSKVLFLPATGVCNDGSIIDDDTTGFYWSKSLGNTDDKGFGLGFDKTNGTTWEYSNSRSLGFAIRPVLEGPAKRIIMGVTQAEKDSWNSKVSGIKIGESGNVNIPINGIVTLPKQEYSLPIASANTLGGVKVGSNLSIDQNGVLSAANEVQIGGETPSSSSDVEIFIDTTEDATAEVYTKQQQDGKFIVIKDLNTAPTASTLTYTENGTVKNFKQGDEVRVPDQNADNGYTFYKLYELTTSGNTTTATWDKLDDEEIVQTTGNSTTAVMSQKAVSDELDDKLSLSGGTMTGNITFDSNPYLHPISFYGGEFLDGAGNIFLPEIGMKNWNVISGNTLVFRVFRHIDSSESDWGNLYYQTLINSTKDRCLHLNGTSEWSLIEFGKSNTGLDNYFGFWQLNDTFYLSKKLLIGNSASVTAGSFIQASDIRKKDIIENINLDVKDIANAPLFKFTWLNPEMPDGVNVGTSAQYWQTILPEIISEEKDDEKTLSMQYGVAALASSVALAKKVVEQEETIKAQEARIKALEDAIAEIQSKLNN